MYETKDKCSMTKASKTQGVLPYTDADSKMLRLSDACVIKMLNHSPHLNKN